MCAALVRESRLLQRYDTCRTIFLCCDIQEKLVQRIPNFQAAVDVSNHLARLHEHLGADHSVFVATEQYPKGVGHLVSSIHLPSNTPVFAKLQPSMLTEDVLPYIDGCAERGLKPVQQAVLWGHESHVCVLQTADELLQRNIRVAIAVDGCSAQRSIDHDVAMATMATWPGLSLSTVMSITMQLVRGEERMMREMKSLLFPGTSNKERQSS